jgi:hypothetical protein
MENPAEQVAEQVVRWLDLVEGVQLVRANTINALRFRQLSLPALSSLLGASTKPLRSTGVSPPTAVSSGNRARPIFSASTKSRSSRKHARDLIGEPDTLTVPDTRVTSRRTVGRRS